MNQSPQYYEQIQRKNTSPLYLYYHPIIKAIIHYINKNLWSNIRTTPRLTLNLQPSKTSKVVTLILLSPKSSKTEDWWGRLAKSPKNHTHFSPTWSQDGNLDENNETISSTFFHSPFLTMSLTLSFKNYREENPNILLFI